MSQNTSYWLYNNVLVIFSFDKIHEKFWYQYKPCGSCTGLLLASTSTNEVCPLTVTWLRNNIWGTPTAGVICALLTWGVPWTIRLLACWTMLEAWTICPAPDTMGVVPCETLVKFCKFDNVPSATCEKNKRRSLFEIFFFHLPCMVKMNNWILKLIHLHFPENNKMYNTCIIRNTCIYH